MKFLAKVLTIFMLASLFVVVPTNNAEALSSSQSSKVIKVASSLKGIKYKYGGTTTRGFDCSGYTKYVFKKATGKTLPRMVGDQAKKGKAVSQRYKKAGDLIVFGNYHVAIYAGGGKIWHSPRTGKSVEKVKIWTSAYKVRRL